MGGISDPAHLVGPQDATVGEFEQRGRIGEIVAELADGLIEHAISPVVDHTKAADADRMSRNGPKNTAYRVGGIEHGRVACGRLPVLTTAVLIGSVEAEVHVMDVVTLAIEDPPKRPFVELLTSKDGGRIVVTGLRHHVDQARVPYGVHDRLDFADRDRHRHSREDMFAGPQR